MHFRRFHERRRQCCNGFEEQGIPTIPSTPNDLRVDHSKHRREDSDASQFLGSGVAPQSQCSIEDANGGQMLQVPANLFQELYRQHARQ